MTRVIFLIIMLSFCMLRAGEIGVWEARKSWRVNLIVIEFYQSVMINEDLDVVIFGDGEVGSLEKSKVEDGIYRPNAVRIMGMHIKISYSAKFVAFLFCSVFTILSGLLVHIGYRKILALRT